MGVFAPASGTPVFAHTTPVYLDVAGRRVARPESARWCLAALDRLDRLDRLARLARLAREQGRFDPARRDDQLGDLLAVVERARAFYVAVGRGAATVR